MSTQTQYKLSCEPSMLVGYRWTLQRGDELIGNHKAGTQWAAMEWADQQITGHDDEDLDWVRTSESTWETAVA